MELDSHLKYLIGNLPRIYQPIYGFEEFEGKTSRTCNDRWQVIQAVAEQLRAKLGRPLRVLDLGCAQGFFCFQLAAKGNEVYGVDIDKPNIELCRELARIANLAVTFIAGECIKETDILLTKEFDLVIGLSVFQHLCNQTGFENTRQFLSRISQKTAVVLIEAALKEEPGNWAKTLPDDARELLNPFAYFQQIATFASPLAKMKHPINRPLFFCSNQYWYVNGTLTRFNEWTQAVNEFDGNIYSDSRRYFFTDQTMLKTCQFVGVDADCLRKELENEVKFLQSGFSSTQVSPRLLGVAIEANHAWLMREKMPGKLLSSMIQKELDYNSDSVIESCLAQLAALESHGLYHNNLRTGSVLVLDSGQVQWINYGAIQDMVDYGITPNNIFLRFIMFCYEVSQKKNLSARNFSPIFLKAENYSPACQNMIRGLLSENPQHWSFNGLLKLFKEGQTGALSADDSLRTWLSRIEVLIAKRILAVKYFERLLLKKLKHQVKNDSFSQKMLNTLLYNKVTLRFTKVSRYINVS